MTSTFISDISEPQAGQDLSSRSCSTTTRSSLDVSMRLLPPRLLGLAGPSPPEGSGSEGSAHASASLKRDSDIWSSGTLSDLGAKKRRFASLICSTSLSTVDCSEATLADISESAAAPSAASAASLALSAASASLSRESEASWARSRAISCSGVGAVGVVLLLLMAILSHITAGRRPLLGQRTLLAATGFGAPGCSKSIPSSSHISCLRSICRDTSPSAECAQRNPPSARRT